MKSIFEYTSYRQFLQDAYDHLKESNASFSYRYFSMKCGYSSPNFLKLVIDGKRNLSSKSIISFSEFFKFGKREGEYFEKLVLFDQEKSLKRKEEIAKSILESNMFNKLHPISKDCFEYYSHWYYVAIREILTTKKIKLDAKNISKLLIPKVSQKKVEDALECLLRLKLIKKKNNYYIVSQNVISTGDEVSSTSVAKYHRDMLSLASDSIERFERTKRDISAVTVSLSDEGARELKLMIQKFRKEVLALSEREKNKQTVYQLGVQMFPLSRDDI